MESKISQFSIFSQQEGADIHTGLANDIFTDEIFEIRLQFINEGFSNTQQCQNMCSKCLIQSSIYVSNFSFQLAFPTSNKDTNFETFDLVAQSNDEVFTYYLLSHSNLVSWEDADKACRKMNAHLFVNTNKHEMSFFKMQPPYIYTTFIGLQKVKVTTDNLQKSPIH